MRARVDAALTLDAREVLPPKVVERLCRMLSFPDPAFLDRLRLGLNPGAELETVCFVEQEKELRLPRGAIDAPTRGRAGRGADRRLRGRARATRRTLDVPALGLRDYQSAAVEKLAKVTQGTVVIPCGGGQDARVGMGAIAKLRTPTLILVHTLDLAEQWLRELKDKLGIEAGLIGDGEERPAH